MVNKLSDTPQPIPQYPEVPPNIEAKRIILDFPAVLVYQSNKLLLKHYFTILIFYRLVASHLQPHIHMILVNLHMKVLSEKRLELSQVIVSLNGSIRTKKGCRRCDLFQSMEDANELCLLEEWDTQENLMTHMKSEHCMVLRGAMNLLEEHQEMMLSNVFPATEMGEI